jgi:hypothetical protein
MANGGNESAKSISRLHADAIVMSATTIQRWRNTDAID